MSLDSREALLSIDSVIRARISKKKFFVMLSFLCVVNFIMSLNVKFSLSNISLQGKSVRYSE